VLKGDVKLQLTNLAQWQGYDKCTLTIETEFYSACVMLLYILTADCMECSVRVCAAWNGIDTAADNLIGQWLMATRSI